MSGFDLLGDPLPEPIARAPKPKRRTDAPSDDPIAPALLSDAHRALSAQLPVAIRLGTSTWSFPGWQGFVYGNHETAQRLSRFGLAAYSQHPLLRTVGIDRTFYAAISQDEFARYAGQVPEHFSFLCKAPNAVTSPFIQGTTGYTTQRNPGFLDAELAARSFVEPALRGLGAKAGPLVFQFSPLGKEATQTPNEMIARVLAFLRAVRERMGSTPALAVEVRNAQLLLPEFSDGLAALNVAYCVGIHPRMPDAAAQLQAMQSAVSKHLVVRWSLNQHSGEDYEGAKEHYAPFNALIDVDIATRDTLANAAVAAFRRGEKVHMVANNKAEGSAPQTMFALAEMIVKQLENREIVL